MFIATCANAEVCSGKAIDVVAPGGKIGLAVQGLPEAYGGIGKGQLKSDSLHWGELSSLNVNTT